MSPVTLGIDLATSSARCLALDVETGAVLARASSALPAPERGAGGVSRQRSSYAQVALDLIRQVCLRLGYRAGQIVALSVTGTSGTVVPCDRHGRAGGDARLYDDTSGAAALTRTGIAGSSMLGRMFALQQECAPARYASSADVVVAALVGGPVASDTSHTVKAGIDLETRTWPLDAMRALGLPVDDLPDLVPPGTPLGMVAARTAADIGLPGGVVVVAGLTDGCTAQLAAGAVHWGDSMGVLGTTLVLKAVSDDPVDTPDGAVYSHLAPDGRFWAGGASSSGAGVLAVEFAGRDLARLDERSAIHGPSTVVRYPLARTGERFPVADAALTSVTSGRPTDEVDAYRAVLEGVAFVERLALETLAGLGVAPRRHVVAGGATASAVWNRIRATILAPVAPVQLAPEASSSLGAAVLAAQGRSSPGPALVETVDRLIPPASPLPADPEEQDALAGAYERFLDLLTTTGWSRPPVLAAAREGAPHV